MHTGGHLLFLELCAKHFYGSLLFILKATVFSWWLPLYKRQIEASGIGFLTSSRNVQGHPRLSHS